MVSNFLGPFRSGPVRDTRREMIQQTEGFLSWALSERDGRRLPRIPRLPMSKGGFSPLLRDRGTRAMVNHWWSRVLNSTLLDE